MKVIQCEGSQLEKTLDLEMLMQGGVRLNTRTHTAISHIQGAHFFE